MDREQFKERFEEMGFDVTEDPEDDNPDDKPVTLAENGNGDQIWWSVIDSPEVWGLYVDPNFFSLDNATFEPHEVEFQGDSLVIPNASGTRSKTVGYGREAYRGEMQIDDYGTEVTQTIRG